ncbi:MAG: hypothetical protein WCV90_06210 [Candidatus Woesearchaeota archaeon]|jgi:hypothetical protein
MVWYLNAAVYLWELFRDWLTTIFIIPFKNVDMLWLLIPVWIAWFFAEFFQEKRGTSMGNAITNAVIILWGSIDCTRQTLRLISEGIITNTFDIVLRFVLIAAIFGYGGLIIGFGIKGNPIIKYIGRVREVTYVFAMFVPVFYNEIPFSLEHILAVIIFFPLFYFFIELLDRYTPNPKAMVEDLQESELSEPNPFAEPSGPRKDPFNTQTVPPPYQPRYQPPTIPPSFRT